MVSPSIQPGHASSVARNRVGIRSRWSLLLLAVDPEIEWAPALEEAERGHERLVALHAGFVRAHAAGGDTHAERGACVARPQRRPAPPGRGRRSHPCALLSRAD